MSSTYDHREWRTGLPVRSAVLKPLAGWLVVGWVTTSESQLLYVFFFFVLICFSLQKWFLCYSFFLQSFFRLILDRCGCFMCLPLGEKDLCSFIPAANRSDRLHGALSERRQPE